MWETKVAQNTYSKLKKIFGEISRSKELEPTLFFFSFSINHEAKTPFGFWALTP